MGASFFVGVIVWRDMIPEMEQRAAPRSADSGWYGFERDQVVGGRRLPSRCMT